MKEKKTFTLEVYEHFLENPNSDSSFSIDQLNEVIFLHGFKKIHKRHKSVLYDALSTIDLIKLQRSTLEDNFHPYDYSPLVSVDQVKQDLDALSMQECPIQSIETVADQHLLCSHSESNGGDCLDGGGGGTAGVGFVSSFKISRKRRRKKKTVSSIVDGQDQDGELERRVSAYVESVGAYDGAAAGPVGGDGTSLFVDTYSWEV
ncbi:uncharacterized protein LOC126668843 [Mercurialis annua]|uniref:uncharacterized protein LOC126668843 n=1 Tax=Mercurialis annua TaxID=3986 RepID=UPI00215EBC34|nr:uncharacterized protein LOC126668843 [Mercurialis annua]